MEATPQSFKTPSPRDTRERDSDHRYHHSRQPISAMASNNDEAKIDCPVQTQAAAAAQEAEVLYRKEARRRWGEEEGDVDAKCLDENNSSAAGDTGADAAAAAAVGSGDRRPRGDNASRSAALRRCNSQQMARISAAAAAVEVAAAAVAAIPTVGWALCLRPSRRYMALERLVCHVTQRW